MTQGWVEIAVCKKYKLTGYNKCKKGIKKGGPINAGCSSTKNKWTRCLELKQLQGPYLNNVVGDG